MKQMWQYFWNLKRFEKLFIVWVITNVLLLLHRNLISFDDWQFHQWTFESGSLYLAAAAFGVWAGYHLLRAIFSKGFFGAITIIALFFVLWAISIPNFRKARESSRELGMSVGGAKDIANFRNNISRKYLPLVTDLTYEGLFYEYFFDTGKTAPSEKLFSPSYSMAASPNPVNGELEYYMTVGLNSNIKEADFKRKKLNLVVVLDISGSMGSGFRGYYYDRYNEATIRKIEEDPDSNDTKLALAAKSIVGLLGHLQPDDRFGMVVFESTSYLAKPLRLVSVTDLPAIKRHILDLKQRGGTNMESGFRMGTGLLEPYANVDKEQYENRLIFLTDAMPNTGDFSEYGLFGMAKRNADLGIYSTFIGMGVDFNTELIEAITKIRGANYYSVHSAYQFKKRMDKEFEYMVTPLVFDLVMKLEAPGFAIEEVYGSPEANQHTGELMKVNTLFPSVTEDEGTKGGIVLLKLKKKGPEIGMKLSVSWEGRTGNKDSSETTASFGETPGEFYQNTGIRKGIVLSRYATLIRNWITRERASLPPPPADLREWELNQWERKSVPLQVSATDRALMASFSSYFESEMKAIGDQTMQQELEIFRALQSENLNTPTR